MSHADPARRSEYNARYAHLARVAVFAWYGSECACCGTTANLTLDHIHGGGCAHRKATIGNPVSAGWPFYRWLIAQGFPPGYQVLCLPCNCSKWTGGRCKLPHGQPTRRCSRCRRDRPTGEFTLGLARCDPCVLADRARVRSR